MRPARCFFPSLLLPLMILPAGILAQQPAAKEKKEAKSKGEPVELDPFNRPEGDIVDQSGRYYIWYDTNGWHLRTMAMVGRHFHGTLRLKNAKIKSCLSVGLKKDKQKKDDNWQFNDARTELKFEFHTGKMSDGFDLVVDGEGEIEFDLFIDKLKGPKNIFVGKGGQHPDKNPFTLPATPKRKT